MLEDEEKLIEQAKSGDSRSFADLYDHYLPPIYRFIYMKVSHREEAEDLTHEIFLSAWQNLDRYRSRGFPFSSWLYQIARNRVIDFYRTKKKHLPIESVDAELAGSNDVLEVIADEALSMKLVREVINELSPDYQDVLLMKFMEELSHAEIAQIMGKSAGAVRLIQHRALQELRKRLKKDTNEL
jgi:RNA polymerase sigma-70 factor (ECF subfamily)